MESNIVGAEVPNPVLRNSLASPSMIAYIMSRKYVEALMSIPEKERPNATNINTGLEYCNKLFSIEKKLKEFDYKTIFTRRIEEAKPTLSAYFELLKSIEDKVVSKSFLGIAVKYSLNQQKKTVLIRFHTYNIYLKNFQILIKAMRNNYQNFSHGQNLYQDIVKVLI